jgi:hypothetical protein
MRLQDAFDQEVIADVDGASKTNGRVDPGAE